MRYLTREQQDDLTERQSQWRRPPRRSLDDAYFDGETLPRELAPRHWTPEGDVHSGRRLCRSTDSTRYFRGPQVTVLRDDLRRLTWAAGIEGDYLFVTEYLRPTASGGGAGRRAIAKGDILRYHISLDKFTGEVTPTWVQRDGEGSTLWHAAEQVATKAAKPDFPFFAYSQVPVGQVQTEEPPFGILGYKDRATGRLVLHRVERGECGPEVVLTTEETVGGVTFGIAGDHVLARLDQLRDGRLVPATAVSDDGGRSFSDVRPIDLGPVVDEGFEVRPGYQRPIVDKGGSLHVPVGLESAEEALALNYVVAADLLVEAVRVRGRLAKAELAVFPSTLGARTTFGNGVTDGHGLIMALGTDTGLLFTSNSSAGGSHFPAPQLLNHEMPRIAEFSASECYSSGQKPNVVSMDYLFIEGNVVGRPISGEVFIETWDMPLPLPTANARAVGTDVEVKILGDADLEAGKVTFAFDDPAITITDVTVHDLRSATVRTEGGSLDGATISFDVLTLFHRHYGEAIVSGAAGA